MCLPAHSGFDSQSAWNPPADLLELARGEASGLLEKLLEPFRTDTESRMEAMGRHLAAGELSRVRSEAHALKGSALEMHADCLAGLCARRQQAADGAWAEAAALLASLQAKSGRIERRMSQVAHPAALGLREAA